MLQVPTLVQARQHKDVDKKLLRKDGAVCAANEEGTMKMRRHSKVVMKRQRNKIFVFYVGKVRMAMYLQKQGDALAKLNQAAEDNGEPL